MKKQRLVFLVILLLSPFLNRIDAQTLVTGLNFGYGSFPMTSLKKLQDSRLAYANLPAQITDDFPPNWTYGIELGLCFRKVPSRLIWFYQFASTGGRVSSVDYSGEMKLDLVANSNQLGIGIEQDLIRYHFFYLALSARVSYLYSAVKIRDYLRIYSQVQDDELRVVSDGGGLDLGLLPGVRFSLFHIGFYGGYLFSTSQVLHLPGQSGNVLSYPGGYVKAQWDGWRFMVKVDVRIPLKKEETVKEEKPAGIF